MKKFLIFIGSLPILVIAILAMLYAMQDWILLRPTPSTAGQAFISTLQIPEQELQFETYPLLRGYSIRSLHQNSVYRSYTFIYGDYNTDVYDFAPTAVEHLSSTTVILTNYSGFGRSAGSPESKRMFQHQLMVFDAYTENSETPSFLIGYGIGANVAAFIASQRPNKVFGVIAIAPAVGLKEFLDYKFKIGQIFDFIPDRWNVRQYLQNIDPRIPLYCVASEMDETIPFELSVEYCRLWPGEVEALQLKGHAHSQLFRSDIVDEMNKFILRRIEK